MFFLLSFYASMTYNYLLMDFHKRADGLKKMPREVSLQDTKKGVPLYSDLVNLKSNTMKNTLQTLDRMNGISKHSALYGVVFTIY